LISKQADGFNKTGCYNTLCPGFVQVSTDIPLGYLLQPVSTYGGKQYEVGINMYKVASTSKQICLYEKFYDISQFHQNLRVFVNENVHAVSLVL